MPIDNLVDLLKFYDNLYFLSYFTVEPVQNKVNEYIEDFNLQINAKEQSNFWILGRQTQYLDANNLPNGVRIFNSIEEVSKAL